MEKLTGLWKRQGKNSEYLSGTLNKSDLQKMLSVDGDIIVMVFQSKKKTEKQPDFEIFYDKKKEYVKPVQAKTREWGYTPDPSPMFPGVEQEAAAMYVPDFGKYKGQPLNTIEPGKLISYCEWMKGECVKSGKPMHEKTKKFIEMANAILNNPAEEQFNDDDLPF